MLRFLLKSALRAIRMSGINSIINLIGLSIGIACCIILTLWITNEYSVNKYLPKDKRIHKLYTTVQVNGNHQTNPTSSIPIIRQITQGVPGITDIAYMLGWPEENVIELNNQPTMPVGRKVSKNYFEVIPRDFLFGDPTEALQSPLSIIISESMAIEHFGPKWRSNISDETLILNEWKEMDVTGVFRDFPKKSTVTFDYCTPLGNLNNEHPGNLNYEAYLELEEGAILDEVNGRIDQVSQQLIGAKSLLLPFSDTYLYSKFENGNVAGGRIEYLRIFILASIFILLMACINFMNLYSTGAYKRIKEIAMKKIVGASNSSVVIQAFLEAFITISISSVIALILCFLSLSKINLHLNAQLALPLSSPSFWLFMIGLIIASTLISGIYPALLLSSFSSKSIHDHKATFSIHGLVLRKGLFIFQFFIAVLLILFSFGVKNQLDFISTMDLGFNKSDIIYKKITQKELSKLDVIQARLKKSDNFGNITTTNIDFQNSAPFTNDLTWPGKQVGDPTLFGIVTVGDNFINTMGIKLLDGRDFRNSDEIQNPIILNKRAADLMGGPSNALNKKITLWNIAGEAVGIVDNFNFTPIYNNVDPLIIAYRPDQSEYLLGKIKNGKYNDAIKQLNALKSEYAPNGIFEYKMLDESIDTKYESENKISDLSLIFTALSILIACIGLFGLSKFTLDKKMRELSIRKVLGASIVNLVVLIAKEFSNLILLALVIAFPIGIYVTNIWMDRFHFTKEINHLTFLIPVLILFAAILVTFIYHTIRVSKITPSKNLT